MKKINNPFKKVPHWARLFNYNEYQAFSTAISDCLRKQGIDFTIRDGVLRRNDNMHGMRQTHLISLIKLCKQSKIHEYGTIVYDGLMIEDKIMAHHSELSKTVNEFDKIKKLLAVRIYNDGDSTIEDRKLGKPLAEGIYSKLVLDLPHSIRHILPAEIEEWDKPFDELYQIGLQNVRANYKVKPNWEKMEKFKVWTIEGEHFFSPNILLDLQKHPKLIGAYGSLIGLPTRHNVYVYPVESMEVFSAMIKLIQLIQGMYHTNAGSISTNLLWYREGNFENLPYEIKDRGVHFVPSQGFDDLLKVMQESGNNDTTIEPNP